MAITQLRNAQVKDNTITLSKLATDFVDGQTWNLSSTNTAVLSGLADPLNNNEAATKGYIDGIVNTAMKSPDGYATNAAGDYPSDYKSSGSVSEGDTFYITDVSNGTAVGAETVNVGDYLVALTDNPGNTDSNWIIMESNRDAATETVKGVVELATQAETDAGTDDTTAVTPLKLATYVSNNEVTADNGLTKTSSNIQLGGNLTKNTNIDGYYDLELGVNTALNSFQAVADDGSGNAISLELNGTNTAVNINASGGAINLSTGTGHITLSADANNTVLANQPDGSVALSVATTKYVDDALSAVQEVYGEAPTVTNGSADVTLSNTPIANTLRVYLNGLRMLEGSGNDYTVSGSTVTFASALETNDTVIADYKH